MEFSFGASATKIIATTGFSYLEAGDILMILVACIMLYLAIWKKFEPLLLLPIGFGWLLANIPMSTMANTDAGGLLNFFYQGVTHEVLPPLIFLGVGALTAFGPLLANPTTLLLGAAAQVGVYIALIWRGDPRVQHARSQCHRHHWRSGWAHIYFYSQQAGPALACAHCRGGLFLYGPGTAYPAPHHEIINNRGRAEN